MYACVCIDVLRTLGLCWAKCIDVLWQIKYICWKDVLYIFPIYTDLVVLHTISLFRSPIKLSSVCWILFQLMFIGLICLISKLNEGNMHCHYDKLIWKGKFFLGAWYLEFWYPWMIRLLFVRPLLCEWNMISVDFDESNFLILIKSDCHDICDVQISRAYNYNSGND